MYMVFIGNKLNKLYTQLIWCITDRIKFDLNDICGLGNLVQVGVHH